MSNTTHSNSQPHPEKKTEGSAAANTKSAAKTKSAANKKAKTEKAQTHNEGTIQFAYTIEPRSDLAVSPNTFADLAAWRGMLQALDLLGKDTARYAGFAFGNMSMRVESGTRFVITASQSSAEEPFTDDHLVTITHCNPERFWVEAEGARPPSSEAVTHGMIYAAEARICCVFHVHNPTLWRHRKSLGLPQTQADVPYGSPAMSAAVTNLLDQNQSRPIVFATAGHEDGIFACAQNARDCGGLLLTYLAKARALDILAKGQEGAGEGSPAS